MEKIPHPLIAIIPIVVLIGFLVVVIVLFGSDSLSGGSQIALLMGMAVCVSLSMVVYRTPWNTFEKQIKATIGEVSITLLILLCVGMLAGSWMISGIVPTSPVSPMLTAGLRASKPVNSTSGASVAPMSPRKYWMFIGSYSN